ncbi:MAG: saccharopine dehydrogenase NADP-binding domain-containing protein, partial [Spirochaetota bacterium]
ENVRPKGIQWAIAGRNENKLKHRQAQIKQNYSQEVEIITVDPSSETSLEAMAAQAEVVITTVGPYAEYGEPVLRACLLAESDYLDITGEPEFVNEMMRKYAAQAERRGVLAINCCGFDSIPADLGTYFTVKNLPKEEDKKVYSYVFSSGTFSGGTWNSAIKAMSKAFQGENPLFKHGAPRLDFHYANDINRWAIPMPVIDQDIVFRSSKSLSYAPNFSYGQFIGLPHIAQALGITVAVSGIFLGAQIPPVRDFLLDQVKPGTGPSLEKRQESFFELLFIGESPSKKILTRVNGGDPGYGDTAKMVSEAALLMATQRDGLLQKSGIHTPASVFGDKLVEALDAKGITFRVI